MPSPIAHIAAGYALHQLLQGSEPAEPRLLLLTAGFAMVPDVDSLAGIASSDFARYHNNASHSVSVGIVAGFVGGVLAHRWHRRFLRGFVAASLAFASHLALDFWATRRGLLLLWPFSTRRFVSPARLLYGFRWGRGLWSRTHLWTLLNESVFAAALLVGARALSGRLGF